MIHDPPFTKLDLISCRNLHFREYAENVVGAIREPLLVLDGNLRVLSANDSFFNKFRVREKQTIGELIYDLGNAQWNIPVLGELLDTILPQDRTFNDFEVQHDFPSIGVKRMVLNARRITGSDGDSNSILLAIEDIT